VNDLEASDDDDLENRLSLPEIWEFDFVLI
jgi:hypothetical protein